MHSIGIGAIMDTQVTTVSKTTKFIDIRQYGASLLVLQIYLVQKADKREMAWLAQGKGA
jgi:hypothetical protein